MTRSTLLACLWLAVTSACSRPAAERPQGRRSAVEALTGGELAGYAVALEPRQLVFPRDHGPHPDFKTEWWYFTGHLRDAGGNRFGYQLTFFRRAVAAGTPARPSAWATRQVYMAHFAVTDVEGGSFRAFERFSRGAVGLAGAGGSRPFRVWLEDWSAQSIGDAAFPVRLKAAAGEDVPVALDLTLTATKPVVLHGQQGFSRKGMGEGNASYYYSLTRLAPLLSDQQLEVSFRYWEGAIGASGSHSGRRITGQGYAELVGYGG